MHCGRDCHVREQGQGGRDAALKRDRTRPANMTPTPSCSRSSTPISTASKDRLLKDRDDVVWTDAHDLETTLLLLPTLEKTRRFSARRSQEAPPPWSSAWGEPLRARLFRHAEGVGRLRWLKSRNATICASCCLQEDLKGARELSLFR
jgi:hypothetical protein